MPNTRSVHVNLDERVQKRLQELLDADRREAEAAKIASSTFVLNMFRVDWSDDEEKEPQPLTVEEALEAITDGSLSSASDGYGQLFSPDYWERLAPGMRVAAGASPCVGVGPVGSVAGSPIHGGSIARCPIESAVGSDSIASAEIRARLDDEGFFAHPPVGTVLSNEDRMSAIVRAVLAVKAAGWPPIFAFVFDELWHLVASLWPAMDGQLGVECLLEPSMFIYALDRNDPTTKSGYVGGNFGFPHRDFPYDESIDPRDGSAKTLSIWIPLNDATLDNGCMYVVPREFDAHFDKPDDYAHMRCATPGADGVLSKLRFDMCGARPLPAKRGSILGWHGNLIHWGSRCSKNAAEPRVSLACSFRRFDAPRTHVEGSIPSIRRQDVLGFTLEQRLQMIANSLLTYKYWYKLEKSAVPDEFFGA
eukprot:TRINITY_DN11517_c0_g1_i1.p1 TRINITY_DN11517_c0_g1~~TRINITY_DN11517_c0_g1_i1.p1  ORF type:complete len:461 (+),score=103.89 TRINITY_DN11517_c0_g1_i1:124-1383(+)